MYRYFCWAILSHLYPRGSTCNKCNFPFASFLPTPAFFWKSWSPALFLRFPDHLVILFPFIFRWCLVPGVVIGIFSRWAFSWRGVSIFLFHFGVDLLWIINEAMHLYPNRTISNNNQNCNPAGFHFAQNKWSFHGSRCNHFSLCLPICTSLFHWFVFWI